MPTQRPKNVRAQSPSARRRPSSAASGAPPRARNLREAPTSLRSRLGSLKRSPSGASSSSVHLRNDTDLNLNVPGAGEITITRRQLLAGAAGVAGIALVGAGAYAVNSLTAGRDTTSNVLKVPESAVTSSDGLTQIEENPPLTLQTSAKMPYGTQVFSGDDSVAACLVPGDEAKPLCTAGILSLGSGSYTQLLSQAVGQNDGFDIFDVRACAAGIVWLEANVFDGLWRVYSAVLDGASMGQALLNDEGDASYEMPTLAAVGSRAFWQLIPAGTQTTDLPSVLRSSPFGLAACDELFTADGRAATALYGGADCVVMAPRADRTHYQLLCMDAQTGRIRDALLMPANMKPFEAGYGPTGFMFTFDAIYNYGDGIANLGTYAPQAMPQPDAVPLAEGTEGDAGAAAEEGAESTADPSVLSEGVTAAAVGAEAGSPEADGFAHLRNTMTAAYSLVPWFRFARTPSAPPSWCGSLLMVKSTASVCGVDLAAGSYCALDVENGADNYGDYLASTGTNSTAVTFSNIDYTPVDGTHQKHCLVRVWA